MNKHKKGFIAMSLIYTFFLLFIAILIYILGYYANNADLLNAVKYDIKTNLESKNNRTWDQNCYSSSLLLNCRLLFKDSNTINPAKNIAAKGDLPKNDPMVFRNVEITNNVGLHVTTESYGGTPMGNSYFYRGAVTNNYVQFGKESGHDIYWQVVRINGDGSIRLIYLGTDISVRGNINNITPLYNRISDKTKAMIIESDFCYEYQNSADITLENIFNCNHSNKTQIGNIGRNEVIALGADFQPSTNQGSISNAGYFLYTGDRYTVYKEPSVPGLPNPPGYIIDNDGILQYNPPFSVPQERPVVSISANSLITSYNQEGTQANPYIVDMN